MGGTDRGMTGNVGRVHASLETRARMRGSEGQGASQSQDGTDEFGWRVASE